MKLNELSYRSIVLGLTFALASPTIFAADSAGEPGRSSGKANPLKNVYFGEQHLHTAYTPDAFAMVTKNTL
jgi:hypothetical protein